MLKFAVSGKSRQTALFFLILIIKVSVTHRRCQILVSAFDFVCIFHPCLNLFSARFEVSESFSTRCQALHFVKLLCFSGLVREQCDIMKSKHFRKATYAICFTFANYFFFLLSKV